MFCWLKHVESRNMQKPSAVSVHSWEPSSWPQKMRISSIDILYRLYIHIVGTFTTLKKVVSGG